MVTYSTDYTDRKLDIAITTGYQGKLEFVFPNKVVSGIQKLDQSFVIKLFTAFQSNIFNDSDGSTFATDLTTVKQGQAGIAFHFLSLSFSEILEQLSTDRSEFPDENLRHARIEEFSQDKDQLLVKIAIVSEANEEYKFILPITLNPL